MGLFDRFRRPAEELPDELTAAVHRVELEKTIATPGKGKPGKTQAWQQEAWERFQDVGELSAVCQWFSNSLSRVRLIASDIDDSTGQPTDKSTDQVARDMVRDIAGGPAGQASLLARFATFLTVPGESWCAIVTRRDTGDPELDGTEEWHVVGDTEINGVGQDIELTLPDESKHLLDPETDALFRVHRPHPRRSADAYSPVLAALPVLREIRRADQTIEAAGKSRVAGNGVLVVPNQLSMPTGVAPVGANPDAPGLPGQEPTEPGMVRTNASHLMGSLQHVMTTAISDPSSAAGTVPIVLQGDGEWIDKIKHLTLDTDITDTNLKVRQDAIRRLALSMDVPPEVLLGNSDSNHWSAWASRDEAISQHIAPMMTLICEALTDAVLRPLLESQGHPNPESVCVWFDLSNLSRRPDRRDEATAAFDRGVISAAAYRAELGYGDEDAPGTDSEEARREQALRMVNQAPSLFPYLAEVLGFTVPAGMRGETTSLDPDLPESVSIPRDSPRSSNPLPSSDPTKED